LVAEGTADGGRRDALLDLAAVCTMGRSEPVMLTPVRNDTLPAVAASPAAATTRLPGREIVPAAGDEVARLRGRSRPEAADRRSGRRSCALGGRNRPSGE